ncbi:MAG: nucleotidyl transferase AbiEii/AbiGii toxin family protein [Sedimentisphaerales bacterium]|nr:nucleotidyl transferase AbiEii/AbiGii toxin family protein [Sedimentisphaerales bacterium]
MDLKKLEEIKRLAIIAMFSDDVLMDTLVLKGGNALDIIYKIANRSSIDLDFSMEQDFDCPEAFYKRIGKSLEQSFRENGYHIFDLKITPRPKETKPDTPDFWGGYDVNFKIVETEAFEALHDSIENLRRNATVIGPEQKKTFSIQISKCEYCNHKREFDLGGYTVYVYSPEMIVFEKLRSVCQQMDQYRYRKTTSTARARDFFDIFTVLNNWDIETTSVNNIVLLKNVFDAKDVPLELLKCIKDYKEFHEPDFSSLRDTLKPDASLESYDFYFDYVVSLCESLCQALGIV